MSKPTALFVGRFQPYHKGHHLVIEGMTKVCGRIIIGIGSSDKFGTRENPFTAQERKEIIQSALQAKDLIPMFDINFINLPDKADDEEWAQHALETAGDVDVLWTGNPDTRSCFEGKLDIQEIKEVPGISSTEIRQMMIDKGEWKEKVPADVAKSIIDIDGVRRIREMKK